MKRFLSIILTIAALVMTFSTVSVFAETAEEMVDYEIAGNLFTNGDFEGGYEGWSAHANGWCQEAHSGEYGMIATWGSGQKLYQNVTLEKNKVYLMSAWFKIHENSTLDGSGATVAFYATSSGESSLQKWNSDLKVSFSKDEWTQMVWAVSTSGMNQDSAVFAVGFNGQSGAVVYIDDFYIGEPVLSDIVLSNVTCSISSAQNTGFIYEWDEDSVDMDFSEIDNLGGYSQVVCYPVFVNQVGTTNEMPSMSGKWSSVTVTQTPVTQDALASIDKSSSNPRFTVTMAPNFLADSMRTNVPEFDVTLTYGDLTKTINFTSAYSSHKVLLTDTNGTVIDEDDALTNGTWTPTYKFYNKDMGWVRYMAISVLYENGVMKDLVVTKDIIKDASRRSNALLTTTATDSLTVTDAENSVIKTFAWRQGNGTSAPVWQMEPLFEANIID